MEMFRSRFFLGAALVWLIIGSSWSLRGADPDPVGEQLPKPGPGTNTTNTVAGADAELQLRTYLKLQEQLHVTLLAIEQARQESSQEFRTNTEALAQRLESLEQSLAKQREEHWQN